MSLVFTFNGRRQIRCLVPFCDKTRGDRKGSALPPHEDFEWICGNHYKAVDARKRQLLTRLRKKGMDQLAHRLWLKIREEALDKGMGIR